MCSKQNNSGHKPAFAQRGFTIMELMITVAIISIIAAIAIPTYRGYVDTTKHSTAAANAVTLGTAQANYYYENDAYLTGNYNPSAGTDASGGGCSLTKFTSCLRWRPDGDKEQFSYNVAAGPCGNIINCYTITVTYVNDPTIVETLTVDTPP